MNKIVGRSQPDIWVSRNFDLTNRDPAQPVGIGIWDAGVDLSVFPRQLAASGKGPAYDFNDNPSNDLLLPLDPNLRQHLPEIALYTRGRHDIAESIDSPEAAALSRKMMDLEPIGYKTFIDQSTEFSDYMHGTHVAGIAVRGNPYARLAAVRYTADYLRNTTPQRLTLERAKRDVLQAEDFIRYFRSQNTRVVNMSWRDQVADWERSLEANGVRKNPCDRKKRAHGMVTLYRDGLRRALA